MNTTSESLLLRLRNTSDDQAWSRFVQLYTPLLFYWAQKTGLQSHDASDLVQDVLAIVFRKLPDFEYDPEKSFRCWLRTITMNKFREFCRKRSNSRNAAIGSAINRVADATSAAESSWDIGYQRSLFNTAMTLLEPEFQPATWKAVREFMMTNRPAAGIAAESGLSVWTIYAAKSRLLARLREELDGLLE